MLQPPNPRTHLRFDRYVALGDSTSIDEYPARDWQELHTLSRPTPGLGAASLLFRNHDDVWPDFRGRDLQTLCPGAPFESFAADVATTDDVLNHQLDQLGGGGVDPTLVSLTVGGNDLLKLLASDRTPVLADADGILQRIEVILDRLREIVSRRAVLLGTVYDPSDGGWELERLRLGPAERAVLNRVNEGIRRIAQRRAEVLLADLEGHFAGHGLSSPPEERWYWRYMLIEPSARGANEVRRVWLQALGVPCGALAGPQFAMTQAAAV